MELTLSWDLFVIVFFALVVTYSFIIGMEEAVKIILATYVAVVSVQGIGMLLSQLFTETRPMLETIGIPTDVSILAGVKLILFVAVIVFLAVRGGFEVTFNKEMGTMTNVGLTGLMGFATAGLLLSTLLTYVTGTAILDATLPATSSLSTIIRQSVIMQTMIEYQSIWFSLPAVILCGIGFMKGK